MMRDHGGDLDRAKAAYGHGNWLDLSTGINPVPFPVPDMPAETWARLPDQSALTALEERAARAYGTDKTVIALAGAQGAIQLVPRLRPVGRAAIVAPTYNEHAAALKVQGWQVTGVADLPAAAGADLAVVVNPNNPDGRIWTQDALQELKSKVGMLIVDESFIDPTPELSLVSEAAPDLIVLRSFGKFYGLAGLRLGFAVTSGETAKTLRALSGPWAVSGPALTVGTIALSDRDWQAATRARLAVDSARLDRIAGQAGWTLIGGTTLFRTYAAGDAATAQDRLARSQIWSRIFPYSKDWIRLGLPGTEADWDRLETCLGQ